MQTVMMPQLSAGPPKPMIKPDFSLNWHTGRYSGVQGFSRTYDTSTRAGAGGVLEQVNANILRTDHDPVTGEYLGAQIEGQATNLVANPTDASSWSSTSATVTDTTQTVGLFKKIKVASTGGDWNRVNAAFTTATAGDVFSVTYFIQAGSSAQARIIIRDSDAAVETYLYGSLSSGLSVVGEFAGTVSHLEQYTATDGIYVVKLQFTSANTTSTLSFGVGPNSTTSGEDIFVLGMQATQGTEPNSFVLLDSSSTTRYADMLAVSQPDNLPQFQSSLDGTYRIRFKAPKYWGNYLYALCVGDGTINFLATRLTSGGNVEVVSFSSGSGTAFHSYGAPPADGWVTAVLQHDGSDLTSSVNGASVQTTTCANGASSVGTPQLDIGKAGNTNHLHGHVYQVDYWKKSNFTSQQLQELSAWAH